MKKSGLIAVSLVFALSLLTVLGGCGEDSTTACTCDQSALEAQVAALQAELATVNGRLTTAEGNVTTLQADLTTVDNRLTTTEGTVTALGGRLTTAEGNVTTLQANLTTVDSRLTTAEGSITTIQGTLIAFDSRLTALENSDASQLDPYLTISSGTINGLAGPHVIFEGVNMHIRNGSGATTVINGVGNLVVGYNEGPSTLIPGDRGGSHNLIVGTEHKYLSYGGLVAGFMNILSGNYASVSGGRLNTASGIYSSVSGGYDNEASLEGSSISGGAYGSVSGSYDWATCCFDCADCP